MSNESPRPRKKAPPRVQPAGASSVRDLVAALGDLGQGGGEDSSAAAPEDGDAGVSDDVVAPAVETSVGEGEGSTEGATAAAKAPREKGRSRRKKGADGDPVSADGDVNPDGTPVDAEAGSEAAAVAGTDGEGSSADGEGNEAAEASAGEGEAKTSRPGVHLVDALPMDDDDDLSQVEGEASARLTMIVESLLFASSKPLSVKELRRVLGDPTTRQIQLALKKLIEDSQARGVVCQQVAGGFVLRTHPDNASWVQRLLQAKPVRLSRPQLETLAVVAYRQPITRPEIDLVRGVDSGATLKVLLERELVQIVGRKEEPGRPLLYGTTIKFLEFFNLTSLRDLPDLREFKELSSEAKAQLRRDMSDDEIEALGQEVIAFARPEGEGTSEETVESDGSASEEADTVAESEHDEAEREGTAADVEAAEGDAEVTSDEAAEVTSDEAAEVTSENADADVEGSSETTEGDVTDDGDTPVDPAILDDQHAAEPEADEAT
jgi:segregation and condensation protein B